MCFKKNLFSLWEAAADAWSFSATLGADPGVPSLEHTASAFRRALGHAQTKLSDEVSI